MPYFLPWHQPPCLLGRVSKKGNYWRKCSSGIYRHRHKYTISFSSKARHYTISKEKWSRCVPRDFLPKLKPSGTYSMFPVPIKQGFKMQNFTSNVGFKSANSAMCAIGNLTLVLSTQCSLFDQKSIHPSKSKSCGRSEWCRNLDPSIITAGILNG